MAKMSPRLCSRRPLSCASRLIPCRLSLDSTFPATRDTLASYDLTLLITRNGSQRHTILLGTPHDSVLYSLSKSSYTVKFSIITVLA